MAIPLFYQVLDIAKEEKCKDEQTIKDLITLAKNELHRDASKGLVYTKHIKLLLDKFIRNGQGDKNFLYRSLFNVLVAETPYSLDSYFQALEFNRPLSQQFYLPRRKQLKPIVDKLEKLLIYDEIDELFLSCPPRVGKTTLIVFIMSWLIGINPEKANLYSSASNQLVNAFFKGVYEILTDQTTYLWSKIFPTSKFDPNSFVNSKECYLDTGRIKRYHSFTGRSIDAESLNGACDCNGILVGDDLCSGIEEALNPTRLYSLWQKVNNNLFTRAKMGAKVLWIGTRWSLQDPIQRRLDAIEGTTRRYDIINIPALDENDESNFDYLYGVGFSTEYFKERRASFEQTDDTASWLAQYCGSPVERSNLLFAPEDLRMYGGVLPDAQPDRIFGHCDPAWGGGDYVVLPVLYKYGNEYYCVDFVCDGGYKNETQPKVAEKIIEHKMSAVDFESNNGGLDYKEKVDEILRSKGYVLQTTSKYASTIKSKEDVIFNYAPDIKSKILFLEPKYRSAEYQKAMTFLTSYTIAGNKRTKKDDVPDALAKTMQMEDMKNTKPTVTFFARPF